MSQNQINMTSQNTSHDMTQISMEKVHKKNNTHEIGTTKYKICNTISYNKIFAPFRNNNLTKAQS